MNPNKLYYYKCVVQEPLFPRPPDAVYYSYGNGHAGFRNPNARKETVFYGTPKEFEQYLKTRRKPAINRSTMYDVGSRP